MRLGSAQPCRARPFEHGVEIARALAAPELQAGADGGVGFEPVDAAMAVAVDDEHGPACRSRRFGPARLQVLLAAAAMELQHDGKRPLAFRHVEFGADEQRIDALLHGFLRDGLRGERHEQSCQRDEDRDRAEPRCRRAATKTPAAASPGVGAAQRAAPCRSRAMAVRSSWRFRS